MSRISQAFAQGKALIPFLTCGDPDLETTRAAVLALAQAGAGMIQLGIPFSDPTAEGPVIQAASARALAAGVTTDKVLELVRGLREETDVPLVLVTYANVVFSYGTQRFLAQAAAAGADGLMLPDVPYEEKEEFAPACREHGLAFLSAVAPTSRDRIAMIAREAEGFLSGLALTPPDVYAAKGGSLEDAYAEADEFFGRFGLERSAGDETLYDDDAWLYSTGRDYFLRYEYTGPVLLYRRMGTSGADTGDRFSEDDIRAGAAAWGVEIPEEAVMGRGEDGSFIFELEPGGNRGGSVVVRCNAESVCEISCRLYDLRRIAAAEPPTAAECISALERGEYSCWDEIPAGDIVIGSASVEYTLDSKGCYRPVLFLSCGAAELHIPMAIA